MGVFGPGQGQQLHVRTLVACLWAALTAGFVYSFSAYSVALQAKFDLSQNQISTIGTAHIAVAFLTFTCGLLVDWVGLRTTLVCGSVLNALSWLIYGFIAVLGWRIPHVVWVFAFLAASATYGAGCTVAAVFSTLAKNFGEERGAAIGIAKAWTGVSSGIVTTLFLGIVPSADGDPKRLILLWVLASCIVLLALLPSPFIAVLTESTAPLKAKLRAERSGTLRRQLRLLTLATLGLIGVTVAASLLQASAPRSVTVALSALIVTGVFAPAWLLVPGMDRLGSSSSSHEAVAALAAEVSDGGGGGAEADHRHSEASGSDARASPWVCGPLGVVRRVEGWLLWFAIFAMQSGAILITTNLGSIVQTRSGLPVSAATAVSLFSCAQSLGRLFGGFVSDSVVARRVARPWCLAVLLIGMAIAQVLLLAPGRHALYAGVILAGTSFGTMYPVMICTITELFGTARIASNYMIFDGSPMALGSILVAKGLAQVVYSAHGAEASSGRVVCDGDACFRLTFGLAAGLQLLAAVAAAVLATRSIVVYRVSVWPPLLDDVGEVTRHSA